MAGQSSPFGQNGWIGLPWLAGPSKGHEAIDFLGINSCSTCKKVSNKPKFVDVYCFCLLFIETGPVNTKCHTLFYSSYIGSTTKRSVQGQDLY